MWMLVVIWSLISARSKLSRNLAVRGFVPSNYFNSSVNGCLGCEGSKGRWLNIPALRFAIGRATRPGVEN
jgi:hypothetical protein